LRSNYLKYLMYVRLKAMINKRSVTILVSFISITVWVLISALNVQRKMQKERMGKIDSKPEEAYFNKLNYFMLSDGRKHLEMQADYLKILGGHDLFFTNPEGIIHDPKQRIQYKALEGSFLHKNQELKLEGSVSISTADASHLSESLYYHGIKKYLEAKGEVRSKQTDPKTRDVLSINSNFVNSWLDEKRTLFVGSVKGAVKRPRVYEQSFDFEAERVEVNQLNSLVNLTGNVKMFRNNYYLQAQKAEIFLENFNKKLKYYVLYDDIKLEEKLTQNDGTIQMRRAYSEKLEGYMAEAKVVLSGAPRVEQGEDLIKGYQITLRENVEVVEVDDSQSSFDLKKKDR
jgi:lipopolysaccharide transport protein LptA